MDFSYPSAVNNSGTVSSFGQNGSASAGSQVTSPMAPPATPVALTGNVVPAAPVAQVQQPSMMANVSQSVVVPNVTQTDVSQNPATVPQVSQPVTPVTPLPQNEPVQQPEQLSPIGQIKAESELKEEPKTSPLHDLANKISQLKSEFIKVEEEKPKDAPVQAPLPPVVDSQPESNPMVIDQVVADSAVVPSVSVANPTSQMASPLSVPVQASPQINPVPESSVDLPVDPKPVVTDQIVADAQLDNSITTNQPTSIEPDVPLASKLVEIDTSTPLPTYSKPKGKKYAYTIEQLLDMVIERDASDLHITVGYPAMLRVDGGLIPVSQEIVTEENVADLVLPVLKEEKRDRLEVNREVDLAYAHNGKGRFRINAFYQKQTLAAALRLIPTKIRSIDELKLPPIYHQLTKLGQGLVLVTGPTGHGKSTTLAGIIQEINLTRACHILTIEDPIEYVFPQAKAMVAQREIQDDTHSWEIALKSALREDPNVILVGEMRDYETIAAAITLAETGHLVFATLHTNNAAQTIDRIIDVFPENQQPQVRSQLSNIIEAVIAQRLIPINGGGRKAVSEIMLANAAVRNLIREAKTHQIDNVIRTSADVGMISLEHSLIKLVRDGEITVERAQEYAVRPEEIVRLLKS